MAANWSTIFLIIIILALLSLVGISGWHWWHYYSLYQECESDKTAKVATAESNTAAAKDAHDQCKTHLNNALDANKTMADANKQLSDNIEDNKNKNDMGSDESSPKTENFTNDANPFYQDRLQGPPGNQRNQDISGITSQYKGFDEVNATQSVNINNEDIAFQNDQLNKIPPQGSLKGSKNLGYDEMKPNQYPSDYKGTEIANMPPGGYVGQKITPDKPNGMTDGDTPMPSTLQDQIDSSEVVFPTEGVDRIGGADQYVTRTPAWQMPTAGNTVEPIQRELATGEITSEMLHTNEASTKPPANPSTSSTLIERNSADTPHLAKNRSIALDGADYLWQPEFDINQVMPFEPYWSVSVYGKKTEKPMNISGSQNLAGVMNAKRFNDGHPTN